MRFPARLLALLAAPFLVACSNPCDSNPNGPECLGTCTGVCAPSTGGLQLLMVYLWTGPDGTPPPACPSATPGPGLLGFVDTPPDVTCSPPCSCSPSAGACFPPSVMTANAASCPASSGTGTAVNLPAQWSGACVASAVASADSVTIGPPGITSNNQCSPPTMSNPAIAGGKTRALRCNTLSFAPAGSCPLATGDQCAYPNVDGFSVCLWNPGPNGDIACPTGWPVKHLYFDDSAACECTCADAVGDSCSNTVTIFGDGACSTPLASTPVSSDQSPTCVPVAPGSAIGSVEATATSYHAGTCAPVLTKSPVDTMCCLQ